MRAKSIRERIRFSVIVSSVTTLLLFFIVMGVEQYNRMDTMMEKKVNYLGELAQHSLIVPAWNMDDKSINDIMDAIFNDGDVAYIAIVENDGVMAQRVQAKYRGKSLKWFASKSKFSTLSLPLVYDDHALGTIDIAVSNKSFKETLYRDYIYLLLLTTLLIFIVILRAISVIRSYIFKPLKEFEDAVTSIADGNMSAVMPHRENNDEIGRLAQAFEAMRHAIKSLIQDLNAANEGLEDKVKERTLELETAHKSIKSSIEYAALIQGAVMPEKDAFDHHFQDYFDIWLPKDVVGGDIYLFDSLRTDQDECVIMVIDCTGHGVAGAFVTMMVKAIEQQVIESILRSHEAVSPAKILGFFNIAIKQLLQQHDKGSLSNAGFDGSILYYNKQEGIVKFSGAYTSLMYTEDNELKSLSGSKHSIGYKSSDANYIFKEHTIAVQKGMRLYLSTDGFPDQLGGEKGFCFGRSHLIRLLNESQSDAMSQQKNILLQALSNYQGSYERNDDITVIGLEI
ncbi:MAG: SpoIIE family protein phosphatase [Mariprofundaceae bacterium]|nr:SpoIIE family protein phosphatase [Mariprofundaceae bacterium]